MNKKKGHTHNQKHLTLTDRTFIEQELVQGSSFKSIADVLGKDPTTISKEVKLHRVFFENYMRDMDVVVAATICNAVNTMFVVMKTANILVAIANDVLLMLRSIVYFSRPTSAID